MKYIIILTINLSLCFGLFAQDAIDSVLTQMEKNNTSLIAFRKNTDADKIGNKTGIWLENPEAGFNYLWGNPTETGNRTDFSITQTFDFPTTYVYKNKISNLRNEQAEMEYQKQQKSLLLKARLLCVELIYHNALHAELTKRLVNAHKIANACKRKFDLGEINILDYNKSQVNLLNISKDLEINSMEKNALANELTGLNGGNEIIFTDSVFPLKAIESDFESWYIKAEESNPMLQWIKQEITISQKQKQLSVAQSLPKITAGYMSEKVTGEHFQGITLGISIPLWENKNTIKQTKARIIALESVQADNKLQFYNRMKAKHSKIIEMQNSISDYRQKLLAFNNTVLLEKALDKGEISLADYILELTIYYESVDKLLEMEFNLHKSMAELNQYL